MDKLLALTSASLAPSPAAIRVHMDYLRKLRGKLTRLRIGGPTPDQDEWDQFMEDLYVYAKTENLNGARQQSKVVLPLVDDGRFLLKKQLANDVP